MQVSHSKQKSCRQRTSKQFKDNPVTLSNPLLFGQQMIGWCGVEWSGVLLFHFLPQDGSKCGCVIDKRRIHHQEMFDFTSAIRIKKFVVHCSIV